MAWITGATSFATEGGGKADGRRRLGGGSETKSEEGDEA